MKNINLESKISNFETQNDSRFINCKVIACHDGINKNNSSFDSDVQLKCAEKSIRGIPLLGHLFLNKETGKYELGGHDIDFDLIDTEEGLDVEIKHLERPFGFIRQDAPVEQEIIDGRRYIVSYGVIWKDYADQLLNIIDENDGNIDVSMEISVDDFHFDDSGIMVISNFTFNGITLLGVEPAMEGAKIRTYSMSDIKSELQEMMRQYSLEKGGEKMEEEKIVVEEVDNQTEFQTESNEEVDVKTEIETQDVDKFEEIEEKVDETNEFELLKSEYETLKESFSNLEIELKELQEKYSDYDNLKEFKENYDRVTYENEVEEVSKMFELDEEEVKELKEMALSKEINVEQLKEKLGFKFAMKQLSNKKETKKEFSSEIQIIDETIEKENQPYNGEFAELLLKAKNRK